MKLTDEAYEGHPLGPQRRDLSGHRKKATKRGAQAGDRRRWGESVHARCTLAGEDNDGTVGSLELSV
jgi:hypothetical protein